MSWLPCPFAGCTVNHEVAELVCHSHSGAVEVNARPIEAPPAPIVGAEGVTEKSQGTPSWFTVTVSPATVNVPLRGKEDTFGVAV